MANYDTIAGLTIPVLSADPSAPIEGELWYNTTVEKFRGYGLFQQNAAWSTNPTGLNSGRRECMGMGTENDGLGFCGYIGGFPRSLATEAWNGTTWTSVQNYGQGGLGQSVAHVGGTGGSSASGTGGYFFPGQANVSSHYQFNGSSWSSATGTPTTTANAGGCGPSQSDKMITGGAQSDSFTWNGSSWATNPSYPASPTGLASASWGSSSTDWYTAPAETPSGPTNTAFYEYNGTAWSTHPTTFPGTNGRSNWGTSSSAASVGGEQSLTATNIWNGTTWSASPASSNNNHVTGLRSNSTSTPSASGWIFGGGPGNGVSAGETFIGPISAVSKLDLDFS
jgi:hypothetical protein